MEIAKFALLLAGFILPGAVLMRLLRLQLSLATSFAGSVAILYASVLALQLCGIRISLTSLASTLLVAAIGAIVVTRFLRHPVGPTAPDERTESASQLSGLVAPFSRMGLWTPIYLLFWAAIIFRAIREPLAGPDIEFRWSFLAEQMLRHGSLDFYPPRSAEDFLSYFWVESIPPGASAVHAWAYACAGGTHSGWTVPGVLLQVWSIHELLWRTAARVGGLQAARFTCLAAAACPLLTWSLSIAQETGLTALALVGLVFALTFWRETRASGWAALAGIFALLGASAREYGPVFPLLGAGILGAFRADRSAWGAFAGAAALSIVWPLRTLILTGNPFYSLGMAGLFPVNERFVSWIEHDAAAFAVLGSASGWGHVARYFGLFAATALVGWAVLLFATIKGRRAPALLFCSVLIVLGLWATSVRYTNGGLFYSLRVASPALSLGALALGVGLAAIVDSRSRLILASGGVLSLLVLVLLPTVLALPSNPWRTPWREWPAFAPPSPPPLGEADETVAALLRAHRLSNGGAPFNSVVLADSPGYQRRLLPLGIPVIPLWSPQVDFFFDATLSPVEAVRRWQESRVRYIVITKWQANLDFMEKRARWTKPPFQIQVVGETRQTAILAIRAGE